MMITKLTRVLEKLQTLTTNTVTVSKRTKRKPFWRTLLLPDNDDYPKCHNCDSSFCVVLNHGKDPYWCYACSTAFSADRSLEVDVPETAKVPIFGEVNEINEPD